MWLCVYECVLLQYFQPNPNKKKELRIWVLVVEINRIQIKYQKDNKNKRIWEQIKYSDH